MAFTRSIKESFPGFGSASNYGKVEGNVQAAGTFSMIIPATGATTPAGGTAFNTSGGPAPSRGRVRLRTVSVNAATTILMVTITVTDGVSVVAITTPAVVTPAGTLVDLTYEFNTELSITSVTATITTGVNTSTWDMEVAMV